MEHFPLSHRISRFFSIYSTWFFLHFKNITPNQISFLGTGFFILGPLCYIKGEYEFNLIGILFVWLGILLDFTDGEVARYRGLADGLGGVFVEPMTHDIKYAFLFVPLALGSYGSFPYPTLLIFLGFAATVSMLLFRLAKLRYVHIIFGGRQTEDAYRKSGEKAFYSKKTIKKAFGYFGGTASIASWLLLATILDKVYLIVIFYGLLFPAIYLLLLSKQYKGIKNIKKI